jgi:hypothetical protein
MAAMKPEKRGILWKARESVGRQGHGASDGSFRQGDGADGSLAPGRLDSPPLFLCCV